MKPFIARPSVGVAAEVISFSEADRESFFNELIFSALPARCAGDGSRGTVAVGIVCHWHR